MPTGSFNSKHIYMCTASRWRCMQQVVLRVKHMFMCTASFEDICQQVDFRKHIFMCTASRWRCMATGSFKS